MEDQNLPKLIPLARWPSYFAGSDGHIWSKRGRPNGEPRQLKLILRSGMAKVSLYRDDRRYNRVRGGVVQSCLLVKQLSVAPLICAAFNGPRPSKRHQAKLRGSYVLDCTPANVYWYDPEGTDE